MQHAGVKLLTINERIDSKTLGVEELLAPADVLAEASSRSVIRRRNPTTTDSWSGNLTSGLDGIAQRVLPKVAVAVLQMPAIMLGVYCDEEDESEREGVHLLLLSTGRQRK